MEINGIIWLSQVSIRMSEAPDPGARVNFDRIVMARRVKVDTSGRVNGLSEFTEGPYEVYVVVRQVAR